MVLHWWLNTFILHVIIIVARWRCVVTLHTPVTVMSTCTFIWTAHAPVVADVLFLSVPRCSVILVVMTSSYWSHTAVPQVCTRLIIVCDYVTFRILLDLWRPLLPYGYSCKSSSARQVRPSFVIFWHPGTLYILSLTVVYAYSGAILYQKWLLSVGLSRPDTAGGSRSGLMMHLFRGSKLYEW